ncbi:6805_t:CDS:2, partial [Entrophospora sp. SA101]
VRREAENVELKAKVMKLSHDFEELKQQTQVITNMQEMSSIGRASTTENISPNSSPNEDLSNERSLHNKQSSTNDIDSESDNMSNSDVCQKSIAQCSTSSIHTETKFNEDSTSRTQEKVEQGLLHELFEFIRGTDSMSLQNLKKTPLNSIFIKQISDIPVDIDLTPELDAKVSSFESQKLIGVKNSSRAHGQPESDTETKVCEETLSEAEISITTTPSISSSQISNLEDIVNVFDGFSDSNSDGSEDDDEDEFLGEEDKVNTSSNPVHNRAYFRNKMEEQYPDLYWEGRDGNNDYYGITDESLCPICKSDHYEDKGIEGRYKCGSYFIKCEQRGIKIEITA